MSFENALSQLETTWGKPRENWDVAEWRRAAETLEKALSAAGRLVTSQARIIDEAHHTLSGVSQQPNKRRSGRPRKLPGLHSIKRPPSGHRNRLPKYDRDTKFVLVSSVESEIIRASQMGKKLSAKEALFAIFRKHPKYKGKRNGFIENEIKTRLAPMLSRFKKELRLLDPDFENECQRVANKWAD